MYADAHEEDFDDDFMREVDAAEAAALELSRKRRVDKAGEQEHSRGERSRIGTSLSHPEAATASGLTPPSSPDTTIQQSDSPRKPAWQSLDTEECCKQGALQQYRWQVDSILIQDGGGSSTAATEERIGKGRLTANCREGSGGELLMVNVVVMAAEGDGHAMEIPRHGIKKFLPTDTSDSLASDSSTSSGPEPSYMARESGRPSPQSLLVLGLEIGCSVVMSGLTLQGEQRRPRPTSGCSSCQVLGQDATLAAAVGPGLTQTAPLLSSPLALPTATPERRRLAPTEFSTPSSGQQLAGERRDVTDPVLARLVCGFDSLGKNVAGVCYSTSIAAVSVPASSSSNNTNNNDNLGAVALTPGSLSSTADAMTAVDPSSIDQRQGGQPGDLAVATFAPRLGTVGATSGEADEGEASVATSASSRQAQQAATVLRETATRDSGQVHSSKTLVGDFDDHAEKDCISNGSLGGRDHRIESTKVTRIPLSKTKAEEGIDVPDGEWRRPLAAAPPSRRRSVAGRRMPKVRDRSRKRASGPVVLHLDDDDGNGDDAPGVGEELAGGERAGRATVSKLSSLEQTRIQGGGGDGGGSYALEERPKKRPLLAEDSKRFSAENGGSGKDGKFTPSPPPRRSLQTKGESSWLALRKALHERYRYCEERGAAEQAAAQAFEQGRGGGLGLNGGNGNSAGEIFSTGLRIFRRQEHAFTYADALRGRLAPEDAVRYKVLSFETSATGRRKFLVCDIRRFEEHYPFTALPDPSLPRRLQPPPVQDRNREQPPCPQQLKQEREGCSQNGKTPCSARVTNTSPPTPLLYSKTLDEQRQQQRNEQQQVEQQPHHPQRRQDQLHDMPSFSGPVGDSGASSTSPPLVRPAPVPSSSASSSLLSSSPRSKPPLRHVYEIIRDGCPCRMYFDLEFACGSNPGLDGEELVRAWINVVAGKLHQDFGLSVGRSNFLDLDSSTPKKFSRHLILHLPGDQEARWHGEDGAPRPDGTRHLGEEVVNVEMVNPKLFQDNSHIGRFVNSLAADLETWRPAPSQPAPCSGPLPPGSNSSCSINNGQDERDRPVVAPSPDDDDNSVAPAAAATSSASLATPPDEPTIGTASPKNMPGNCNVGESGSGGALERLWVKDGDGRSVLFADVSVYTRNRCFRLLGSSKFGKSAALQVAMTNRRALDCMVWKGKGGTLANISSSRELHQQQPRDVARTLLHDSLVVPAGRRPAGERFLTVAGCGGGTAGQHRMYSRFGDSCKIKVLPHERQKQQGHGPATISCSDGNAMHRCGPGGFGYVGEEKRSSRHDTLQRHGQGQGHLGDGGWSVTSQGFGPSPFPAVDAFLRTLVCQGGTTGQLRQWSYTAGQFPSESRDDLGGGADKNEHRGGDAEQAGLARSEGARPAVVIRKLTHQVANNRWCWNIGRAHKSNHVFLVTDLSRGEVRQHCHDQECRRSGYRSNPVRLPPGVVPSKDDIEMFELDLGLATAVRESPEDWAAIA